MIGKRITAIRKESIRCFSEVNKNLYRDVIITKTVENNTCHDIRIVHRNNIQFISSKCPHSLPHEQHILLKTIYNVSEQNAVKSFIDVLNNVLRESNIDTKDVKLVCDQLVELNNRAYNSLHIASIVVERLIPLTDIKRNNALYVIDEDILICNPDIRSFTPHPYSEEGVLLEDKSDFIKSSKHNGIFLDIVDNEQKINSRVMYVAKRPVTFIPRQDASMKSGVYLTIGTLDHDQRTKIESTHMTFEEAEQKIGLHSNEQDAISDGDPSAVLKNEELRLKRLLQEANERVLAADEAVRIANREAEEAKARRNDWYDDRKTKRADHYEEKSYIRKDSTEIWKLASAICITALSVYAAVTKANSSK